MTALSHRIRNAVGVFYLSTCPRFGWEHENAMTTHACCPRQGGQEFLKHLQSLTLAREQENATIVHAHLPQPGSGGVLQSLVLSSFSKAKD